MRADASTTPKHSRIRRAIETEARPTKQAQRMKILCVLYEDPSDGMPETYPLPSLPVISNYPDGMPLPTPKGRDFNSGTLLGCVSGELGLRKFLEDRGHSLVVTSDKDADGCAADRE